MKKHIKYLSYLLKHKWFVLVAGLKLKVPLWRLVLHDWTKFLPSEWFPYAEFFYGSWKADDVKRPWEYDSIKNNFDRAWLYHQNRNKHHFQYWLLTKDIADETVKTVPLKIPEVYVREMIADWMGAGRAQTGKWEAREWYLKNREEILLHSCTVLLVERIFDELLGP